VTKTSNNAKIRRLETIAVSTKRRVRTTGILIYERRVRTTGILTYERRVRTAGLLTYEEPSPLKRRFFCARDGG